MDIHEIKRRVELLKSASLQNAVLVKDVAKELKVSQTDLMQFILDNPKLFQTEEVWSWKKKAYKEMTRWGSVKREMTVKDKCKGLGIRAVFLSAEENLRTDEGIAIQIKKYKKTVWLSEWNNYGTIEGFYIKEDMPDDKDEFKKHLWRNTKEKIAELNAPGLLKKKTFYIGGAFDCTEHPQDTAMDSEQIQKAEKAGWTIIKPDSK